MIDKALDVLANSIHDYLKRLPELNITGDKKVHLASVVKADGSPGIPENSLGVSLINIEEEKIVKSHQAFATAPDGRIMQRNPDLNLNLSILIAAYFTSYKTGLAYLSAVIRFFQSQCVFTPQTTPELDSSIQKLVVELVTHNLEQLSHLWGLLGANYLPSVVYKVRLITIQEAQSRAEQPPVKTITSLVRGR